MMQIGVLLLLLIWNPKILYCDSSSKPGDKELTQELDLYLLIGQSNMAGRASIEIQDKDTLSRVYLYVGNEGIEWEKAANPLNKYSSIRKDVSMQKLGPGYSFARKMADASPDKKIGIIVNARGGTSITEWKPGETYYQEAILRTREAMKSGKLKGIIWHQGESDVSKSESYIDLLSELIDAFRKDFEVYNLPFIAGQLSEDRPERAVFNQMILKLPTSVPYTGVARSKGTSTFDNTHFDSASQRLLGERYASEMLKVMSK